MNFAEISMFAHLVARPEADLDLARATLVIAEPEYPGLDVGRYIEELDRLGKLASQRVAASPRRAPLASVIRFLYEEVGFRGNTDDYYDPRNSFLNEVLDRRLGIPLTLALVVTEVGARAGIDARGVSFPGHFLVRIQDDDGGIMLLDPFDGRLLDELQLNELHARATGGQSPVDPRLLEPARKIDVLMRLLNNLRGVYERRGDRHRLLAVLARMQVLRPDDQIGAQVAELASSTSPVGSAGMN